MTTTIYGWVVVREDGYPLRNTKGRNVMAVFDQQGDARELCASQKNSRVVPCVIEMTV